MFFYKRIIPLFPYLLGILFFTFVPWLRAAPPDPTKTTVTVSWDPNPELDIHHYLVRFGTYSGSSEYSVVSAGATTSATLKNLGPGTWYCAVRALNTGGLASVFSDEISFVIPGAVAPELVVSRSGTILPAGSATVAMGATSLDGPDVQETITLENTGGQALSGLSLKVTGSDFSATPLPGPTLAAGAKVSFTVTFHPLAVGDRKGSVRISDDRIGGSAFVLNLTGSGTAAPEIEVDRTSGAALATGVSTLYFNSASLGVAAPAETLTLRNVGTAPLSGLAMQLSGTAADDFTVTAPSASVLAPGEVATVQVSFKPTASGTRVARMQIASNDPAIPSFAVLLIGTGTAAPEIAVSRASGVDLASGTFIGFGRMLLDTASASEVFTVANQGNAILFGLKISVDGRVPDDFVIIGPGTPRLAPGETTTFQVVFRPSARGIRSASLHLASNDADESPFQIPLGGLGFGSPEIEILHGPAELLTSGLPPARAAGGGVLVGSSGATDTYTIRNVGTADLTDVNVTVGGSDAGDFLISGPSTAVVSPGASSTFQVTFRPRGAGTRAAVLHVASNDADENPFDIPLAGTSLTPPPVGLPQLQVVQTSAPSDPGAPLRFGKTPLGKSSAGESFTVTNTGTAELTGLDISTSGPAAVDFVISGGGDTTLAPGEARVFKVNFKPTAEGTRAATLWVTGADSGAGKFQLPLDGAGVAVPHIEVRSAAGNAFRDGSAFVSLGTCAVGSRSKTQVLTIRNTGTGVLSGLTLSGGNSEFAVSRLKVKSLAPGKSTSVFITFKPRKKGTRWGSLHIASSDTKSGSFDLVLTGYGNSKSSGKNPPKPIVIKSAFVRSAVSPAPPVVVTRGVEVIGGLKYRSLTLTAPTGVTAADIEVSGDLLDWSSGTAHTTLMVDTASVLKIRDNTPVTADTKRYIRVRSVVGR